MKDQYLGDINDYLKYGLLRRLQEHRRGDLVVAWMLTANDGRRDGSRVGYLRNPDRYRGGDPALFDALKPVVLSGQRSVATFEGLALVHRARYFNRLLGRGLDERVHYFDQLNLTLRAGDLVALIPDNGLEVRSIRVGHRGSERYLFWTEIRRVAEDHSVVVYQHYWRQTRAHITSAVLARARQELPSHGCFAVAGPRALYLFAALPDERAELQRAATALLDSWPEPLRLAE